MTPSNILLKVSKFILRTITIVIGIIFAIFGYTIILPILRVIGWVISAGTFLLVTFWSLT